MATRAARPPTHPPSDDAFTAAEWSMLQMVANGKRYHDVAVVRNTSYQTIKNRFSRMLEKASVWHIAELVAYGFRQGRLR